MTFVTLLAQESSLLHIPLAYVVAVIGALAGAVAWLARMGLQAIRDERATLVASHAAHIADLVSAREQEQERTLRLLDALTTLNNGSRNG